MSRECANLSNFEGLWFVAQFLPIAPQPNFFLAHVGFLPLHLWGVGNKQQLQLSPLAN